MKNSEEVLNLQRQKAVEAGGALGDSGCFPSADLYTLLGDDAERSNLLKGTSKAQRIICLVLCGVAMEYGEEV